MKDVLVIKCNAVIKPEDLKKLREIFIKEKEEGVIVLPPYVEALIVPEDVEIRVEEAETNEDS